MTVMHEVQVLSSPSYASDVFICKRRYEKIEMAYMEAEKINYCPFCGKRRDEIEVDRV